MATRRREQEKETAGERKMGNYFDAVHELAIIFVGSAEAGIKERGHQRIAVAELDAPVDVVSRELANVEVISEACPAQEIAPPAVINMSLKLEGGKANKTSARNTARDEE